MPHGALSRGTRAPIPRRLRRNHRTVRNEAREQYIQEMFELDGSRRLVWVAKHQARRSVFGMRPKGEHELPAVVGQRCPSTWRTKAPSFLKVCNTPDQMAVSLLRPKFEQRSDLFL